MTVRRILLILALLTSAAFAQQGNTLMQTASGAPTGNCAFMFLYVDSATGNLWNCLNGVWNQATGGTGAVSSVFTRTGAVVAVSGDYTAAQVTNAVALNAANTFTAAGTVDLRSASVTAGFAVPKAGSAAPTADGFFAFDSTTHVPVYGSNTSTLAFAAAAAGAGSSATNCASQVITAISAIIAPTCSTLTTSFGVVMNNAANTGTGTMTLDMSASNGNTSFRLPTKANAAPASTGGLGYDTTAGRIVAYRNGFNSAPTATVITQTDTITGADYTNATTTPSTVFSFTLPATTAAAAYKYDCSMLWESTAATLVGPVFGVNLSAAPTQLTANAAVQNTLAGADVNGYLSNTTTGSQTLVTSSAAGVTSTNYWAKIWGTIEGAATAGSTFIINAASTSATTALLNIRRGGVCTLTWE